jgi:hypothetical protein
MIRVLTLGSFLCLAACGMPTTVKCTAANCSGCCTDEGECLGGPKQSRQACGSMGGSCRVCLPQQLCNAGACVRDPDAGFIMDDAGTTIDMDAGVDSGVSCGARLQVCCGVSDCFIGLSCLRGVCDLPVTIDAGPNCGALGQVCCANQTCTGAGTTCSGGNCVAMTPPDGGTSVPDAGQDAGVPLKATGESCALDRECIDGVCLAFGFDNGYCTKGCNTSGDCVAGSQCGTNSSGVGPLKVCLKQCSSPGQAPGGCRASYVCEANAGTSGVPVCFPACVSNTTCAPAPTCDTRGFCCGATGFACCEGTSCQSGNTCMSGTCRASAACGSAGQACCTSGTACQGQTVCQSNTCTTCGSIGQPCCASNVCSQGTCTSGTCQATAAMGGVGSPCSNFATDCTGNTCFTGGNYVGGYCSQAGCTSGSCPSGSTCSGRLFSGNTYCVKDCQWDGGRGDCRTGYVCDRFLIAGPPNTTASCIAACSNGSECPTGQCSNGFCCGGAQFRCCNGTSCSSGLTCTNGYCL